MRPYPLLAAALAALSLPIPLTAQAGAHGGHGYAGHTSEAHPPELYAQLEEVRRATERYRDHANALRDGFRRFGQEGALMGEHWYHPDRVGLPFDPRLPSTLQYATIAGKKELVGVAYTVYRMDGEPIPEGFAGSADAWHVHDVRKLALAVSEDRPFLRWVVERRVERGKLGHQGRPLLTMVHAWVWSDNPDGVFGHQNRALPYLRAGLPLGHARAGDEKGAQGIGLLAPGACEAEVRGADRAVRLTRAQERGLREACTRGASAVRAAVVRGADAETLNGTAATAWEAYQAARDRILTPDQRRFLRDLAAAAVDGQGAHGGHAH